MKKIFLVLILILFFSLPVFSDIAETDEDQITENIQESFQTDEVERIKSSDAKKNGNKLIQSLKNGGIVADFVANLIENIMLRFINIHNTVFGMSRVRSALEMPVKVSLFSSSRSLFSEILTLFMVIYILMYAINSTLHSNLQITEVLHTAIRVIVCLIVFYFLPFLPTMLINIAFKFSTFIIGNQSLGDMTYSTPIVMTKGTGTALLLSGVASAISSLFEVKFIIGMQFSAISFIPLLIFAIFMGGFLLSFIVAIQFILQCLDLYITNFLMIIVLPSTILKGWGNKHFLSFDTFTLIRYYFVNFLEIFSASVIINVVRYIYVDVINTSDFSSSNPILIMVQYIAQPLLLTILLPASSKILSSLLSGNVSNTNYDVSHAVRQGATITAITGATHAVNNLFKASVSNANNNETNKSDFCSASKNELDISGFAENSFTKDIKLLKERPD